MIVSDEVFMIFLDMSRLMEEEPEEISLHVRGWVNGGI